MSHPPIATIQNQNKKASRAQDKLLSDEEFPIADADVSLLQQVDANEKKAPAKRRRNTSVTSRNTSPVKTPKRTKVQEPQTPSAYGLRPMISPSGAANQDALSAFEARARVYGAVPPATIIQQSSNGAMLPPDLVTNPPTQNVASVSDFDDLDGDSDIEVGKGKGKAGRPSNDNRDRIRSAFDTVDSLFSQLSQETSLSVDTIRSQYNKRTGAYSDWNAYGSYFAKNQEEELGRLPPDASRDVSTVSKLNTVRSATWKLFKMAHPDYSEVLQAWKECEDIAGGTTLQQRHRSFKKIASNMESVAIRGENLYGFRSFIGVVGDVVGSDRSLAQVYVSPGLEGVLENSCFGNKETFQDHLQTWAYADGSKKILLEAARTFIAVAEAEKEVDDGKGTDEGHLLNGLRHLARSVGLTFQIGVPWVNLLDRLASHGAYIQNYPHSVPLPNAPVQGKKSKGIKNLSKAERDAMVEQIGDPIHPMRFVSVAVQDIKSNKVPILIYAPPPSTAKQAHAERVFYDGSVDFNGPPRLLKGSDKKPVNKTNHKQPSMRHRAVKKSTEFVVNDDDDNLNNSDTHEESSSDDDGPSPSPRLTRSRSRAREMLTEGDSGSDDDGHTRGKSVTIDDKPTGAPAVASKPTRAQPKKPAIRIPPKVQERTPIVPKALEAQGATPTALVVPEAQGGTPQALVVPEVQEGTLKAPEAQEGARKEVAPLNEELVQKRQVTPALQNEDTRNAEGTSGSRAPSETPQVAHQRLGDPFTYMGTTPQPSAGRNLQQALLNDPPPAPAVDPFTLMGNTRSSYWSSPGRSIQQVSSTFSAPNVVPSPIQSESLSTQNMSVPSARDTSAPLLVRNASAPPSNLPQQNTTASFIPPSNTVFSGPLVQPPVYAPPSSHGAALIKMEPGTSEYPAGPQQYYHPFPQAQAVQPAGAASLQQQIAILQAQLAAQQQGPYAPYGGQMYPQYMPHSSAFPAHSAAFHHAGSAGGPSGVYPGSGGSGAGAV